MMENTETITVTAVGSYNGHNTKKNKLIELQFKFGYDERIGMVKVIALVGQNIKARARVAGKTINLGSYNFNGMAIDRDGQTVLKLSSDIDFVETENLVLLARLEEEQSLIILRFSAEVEMEESE